MFIRMNHIDTCSRCALGWVQYRGRGGGEDWWVMIHVLSVPRVRCDAQETTAWDKRGITDTRPDDHKPHFHLHFLLPPCDESRMRLIAGLGGSPRLLVPVRWIVVSRFVIPRRAASNHADVFTACVSICLPSWESFCTALNCGLRQDTSG